MLAYLPFDIICSSKLTVFLELRSKKTVRFLEQMMSMDKYLSTFPPQVEAFVNKFLPQSTPLMYVESQPKKLEDKSVGADVITLNNL